MNCTLKLALVLSVLTPLAVLLGGCSHAITAVNAAPNVTPGENRQAMIDWHRQHDRRPTAPPPGG